MKTAKQWIESYERGDSPNEREIREIQHDAMRAGLEVAIERMKDFWGHEIVRAIAADLCRKNGLDVPKLPFNSTRNPPTPSEVPPPKVHQNWGNAPLPEPGYPPPVTEPGPLFPSQSPSAASLQKQDLAQTEHAATASAPRALLPPQPEPQAVWGGMVGSEPGQMVKALAVWNGARWMVLPVYPEGPLAQLHF